MCHAVHHWNIYSLSHLQYSLSHPRKKTWQKRATSFSFELCFEIWKMSLEVGLMYCFWWAYAICLTDYWTLHTRMHAQGRWRRYWPWKSQRLTVVPCSHPLVSTLLRRRHVTMPARISKTCKVTSVLIVVSSSSLSSSHALSLHLLLLGAAHASLHAYS